MLKSLEHLKHGSSIYEIFSVWFEDWMSETDKFNLISGFVSLANATLEQLDVSIDKMLQERLCSEKELIEYYKFRLQKLLNGGIKPNPNRALN